MDLGLFIFLGIFAYSSLVIRATTDRLFIVLPILGFGVISAALLGTFAIANESIIITTSSIDANMTSTLFDANGTMIQYMQNNSTSPNITNIVDISQPFGVAFFMMFHFFLAFLNVVNAFYFIGDKIDTKPQFKR